MIDELLLPDYRAKRKHLDEWVYGIPVIDDSGSRIMSKKTFHLPTGDYSIYLSTYDIDPDTLQICIETDGLEKIYIDARKQGKKDV